MYLYVWADGRARQSEENLSVLDCLAVKQGLLHVYKSAPPGGFFRLDLSGDKARWAPVTPAAVGASGPARCHF